MTSLEFFIFDPHLIVQRDWDEFMSQRLDLQMNDLDSYQNGSKELDYLVVKTDVLDVG